MLITLNVKDFIEKVQSNEPAPGGGSVSALAGTLGAALFIMVSNLSINHKKYADYTPEMNAAKEKMIGLGKKLLTLIDKDTEAFNTVAAVFQMSKETEVHQAVRKEAMLKALKFATAVPFELMETINEALGCLTPVIGKTNTNADSDLGVAVLQFNAALKGAWLNVLINLSSIDDAVFVSKYKEKGQQLLVDGCLEADTLYERIVSFF